MPAMLFPASALRTLRTISDASMPHTCTIYARVIATGAVGAFGQPAVTDADRAAALLYDGTCHILDRGTAFMRAITGDVTLEADALVRIPPVVEPFAFDEARGTFRLLSPVWGANTGEGLGGMSRPGRVLKAFWRDTMVHLAVRWDGEAEGVDL